MNKFIRNLKKNSKKNNLTRRIIFICCAGLFAMLLVFALAQSRNTLKEKQAELDALLARCEEQQLENDALRDLMNNSDDEYIERKAREELDYVLPGERVYIIRSGN